jgi:hypothetical protein
MNVLINFTCIGDTEFPSDPWQMTPKDTPETAWIVEVASLGASVFKEERMVFENGLEDALMKTPAFLDSWRSRAAGTLEACPVDVIYGIHIKSVLLRLLGRWAVLRGAPNCNLINPPVGTPVFQDLCELFNYPAGLTKEERYSFSPARIDRVLNIKSGSSTEAAWNLARRFIS